MKKYWVTRDEESENYTIWFDKPYFDQACGCWVLVGIVSTQDMSRYTMESLTDIRLPGGKDSIVCISGFKAVRA